MTLDELMANLKEAIEAHLEAFGAEDFLNLFTAEITKSVKMRYLRSNYSVCTIVTKGSS
uniref:Uncharacterized protein n=1 Tax=Uncultured archaeon GZfos26G2 TaxID=3386331 RepID=Q648L5_UNCAG|nr:hypothetical protein GZ37D1_9 [uncultured archaeon GZfos37D1]